MTIIAGFKCEGGIVVCADTQETMSLGNVSISKRNVPKLRFEENLGVVRAISGLPHIAFAACGAGYGPFIDKIVDEVWKMVKEAISFEEACGSAEAKIKSVYEEYGQIYQVGSLPEVELIYGIKAEGQSRLFQASGPIVNEKNGYAAAGCGTYMADYLASSMYRNTLTVRQCAILAAYILFQAKEHVDGCGGESHIAVLRDQESCGRVDANRIEAISTLLSTLQNHHIGNILLSSADLSLTSQQFIEAVTTAAGYMDTNRSNAAERVKNWDEFWKQIFPTLERDDLGLYVIPKLNS